MKITLIFICIFLVMNVEGKKRTVGINRAARPQDSSGPCTEGNKCPNPLDVCQLLDLRCYNKYTPGLNDNNNNNNNNRACVDKNAPGRGSDCPHVQYLCNNPIYYQLMTEQCPATCRRGACGK